MDGGYMYHFLDWICMLDESDIALQLSYSAFDIDHSSLIYEHITCFWTVFRQVLGYNYNTIG